MNDLPAPRAAGAGAVAGPSGAEPPPPTYGEGRLGPFLREMSEAILEEVAAAKRDPHRHFWVFDGEPIGEDLDGTLVRFRCERVLPMMPESPVVLHREGEEELKGTLIAVEEFDVVVFLRGVVDRPIQKARLSSEPWFIHEALRARLAGIGEQAEGDLAVPLALLGEESAGTNRAEERAEFALRALSTLADPSLSPNAAQQEALVLGLGSRLHFVWGPPGTGKTASLAQTVRGLVEAGERVLVLAHANVAVDVAILRVADAFEGTETLADGRILRVGVPQLAAVRERGPITPEAALQATQPELMSRRDALEAERRRLVKALRGISARGEKEAIGERLKEIRAALVEIRKAIDAALERLLQEAKVLAATLSRSAIDARLAAWPAEALVVDEVSMAPFPFLAAAATMPERNRCVLFGDFRQLPPVVAAETRLAQRWLGRDAFEIAGVKARVDAELPEERVTLLDVQYRMAPEIAEVVGELSYQGRLRAGEGAGTPRGSVPFEDPWQGASVVCVDTGLLGSLCLGDPRPGSFSRANPMSALMTLELAGRLRLGGVEQLVALSPYRAQARLFDTLLGEPRPGEPVRAATIHRFQGSEQDVVLLDFVDAPPAKGPSRLTDRDAELARRLLNVAMSRARWKLVVVGSWDFLLARATAGGPLRQALALLRQHGRFWRPEAAELRGAGTFAGLEFLGTWDLAASRVAGELDRSTEGVVLNWPGSLPASLLIAEALMRVCGRAAAVPPRLYLPLPVAKQLESTAAELHLLERSPAFFARLAPDRLLLGGNEGHHMVCMVRGKSEVEALLGFLDPEPGRGGGLSAESQHELDRLSGRCLDCGTFRRPRRDRKGGWVLRCSNQRHDAEPLSGGALVEMLEALHFECPACGRPMVVRATRRGAPRVECPDRGKGCEREAVADMGALLGGG